MGKSRFVWNNQAAFAATKQNKNFVGMNKEYRLNRPSPPVFLMIANTKVHIQNCQLGRHFSFN